MTALFQSAMYLGVGLVLFCLLVLPLAGTAVVCILYFLWEAVRNLGRRRPL